MDRRRLCLLLSLIAAFPAAASPEGDAMRPCVTRLRQLVAEPLSYRPRTMIVTLPDPLESGFAREFDILFLAFQQAMASDGFVQDVACLTWTRAEAKPRPDPRVAPSVVLFRHEPETMGGPARKESVILAVFLVGELPHTGVHPKAMGKALDWAGGGGRLAPEQGLGHPLRILGPTFSGSARSLAAAISTHRRAQPVRLVAIRSGTATSGSLPDILGRDGISFRSFGTSNAHLQRCVWNRLVPERLGLETSWTAGKDDPRDECSAKTTKVGADNSRVALLVESSVYGRDFEGSDFHVIPFPTHIGAMREAYVKLAPPRGRSEGEAEETARALPFVAAAPSLQGMTPFGDQATLSSQDLVLTSSLRRLARKRVQVVAIIATNTADKVFLAEKVRSLVPDARLVTFEGDLLLSHPQFLSATAGMLVASSSALELPDAFVAKTEHHPTRLFFDSDGAQGVYRAARDLERLDAASRAGYPFPRADEASQVVAAVVARSGLQPLDRYEVGPATAAQAPVEPSADEASAPAINLFAVAGAGGRPSGDGTNLPVLWIVILLLASALLGLVGWLVLQNLRAREPLLGLVPLDLVAPRHWTKTADQGRLVLHALVALFPLSAGLLYFVLAVPALGGAPQAAKIAGLPVTLIGNLAYACIAMILVAAVYLVAGLAVRTSAVLAALLKAGSRGKRASSEQWVMAVLPLAEVVAGCLVAVYAGRLCVRRVLEAPGGPDALLVERTFSVDAGVSPALPAILMIAVLLGWALLVLRREEVLKRLCPPAGRSPSMQAPDVASDRFEEDCEELWRKVGPVIDLRACLGWWVALVAVPALYLGLLYGGALRPPLRGIEGGFFDPGMSLLFLVILMFVVAGGVWLVHGWRALRRFASSAGELVEVGGRGGSRQVPSLERLRAAFARLPAGGPRATADVRSRVLADGATLGALWIDLAFWLRGPEARAKHRQAAAEVAKDFAAAGAAQMVQAVFRQLRHLMLFLTVALVVLFFAIGAYPFEPRRVMLVYLGLLVAATAALCVWVTVQANRDPAVVQLAGATEAAGSWAPLVQRLSFFAGLPALSLLTGHFPQLRQVLGDWVQPLLNALH